MYAVNQKIEGLDFFDTKTTNTAAIVAFVVALLVLIAILGLLVYYFMKRRN